MKGQSYYQKNKFLITIILSSIFTLLIFVFSNFTGLFYYSKQKIRLIICPPCENELISFLNETKYSLKIEVYVLTNQRIIKILNQLAKKGIDIKIILDEDVKANKNTVKKFSKEIKYKFGKESKKLTSFHAKFVVRDEECAWIGSMNWNVWGLRSNREVAVIVCDNSVKKLVEIFNEDWLR